MAEKRVSVRLSARGGDAVKRTFREIGETGRTGFASVRAEMARAERRVDRFERRLARFAAVGVAAATGALGALVKRSLSTIDAQAKLAQSLQTTTESVQILQRAAELSGSSFTQIEAGVSRFTKRLSLAEQGIGAGADAFERLGLSAADFQGLDVVERIVRVREAIERFIPPAQRAGVITKIFGDDALRAFTRLDTQTLRQATTDVREFGAAVSEAEADQIERTNDAISRLGVVATGLGNTAAVAVAPGLQSMADAIAASAREGGALRGVVEALAGNLDRIGAVAGAVATLFAGRLVASFVRAAASARGVATALVAIRRIVGRLGLGVLIAVIAEVVTRLGRLNVTLSDDARRAFAAFGELIDFGVTQLGRLVDAAATGIVRVLELIGVLERPINLKLQDAVAELRDVQDQLSNIARGNVGFVPGGSAQLDERRANLQAREAELLGRVQDLEQRRRALRQSPDVEAPAPFTSPPAPGLPSPGGGAGAGGAGGGGGAARRFGGVSPGGALAPPRPDDGARRARSEAEGLARSLTGPFAEALRDGRLSVRSFADATAEALRGLSARLIERAFEPLEDFIARFFQRVTQQASGGGGGGSIFGQIAQTVLGAAGSALSGGFSPGGVDFGGGVTTALSLPGGGGGVPAGFGGGPSTSLSLFAKGGVIERPSVFPIRGGVGMAGENGIEAIMPLRRGRNGEMGVAANGGRELNQNVVIVDERQSIGDFIASPEGERALVVTLERAGFRRG